MLKVQYDHSFINNNHTFIQKCFCVSLCWTLPTISEPHRLRLQVSHVGVNSHLAGQSGLIAFFSKGHVKRLSEVDVNLRILDLR